MTLTQAAYWTRRLGVVAIGAGVVVVIIIVVILNLSADDAPQEYLQANFACTQTREEFILSKLEIPSLSLAPGSNLVYELETETGQVDELPRIINVHSFNILGQSLNSQGEAKIIANKLGFDPEAILRRGAAAYLWNDTENNRTLEVDASTLNFRMHTDFTQAGSLPSNPTLPTEGEAIQEAVNLLRSSGMLFADYAVGIPQTVNINVEPDGSFTQAGSKAEAELIRVDFYREKPIISIKSNLEGATAMRNALESKLLTYTTDSIVTDGGRIDVYNFDTIVTHSDPRKPNISVYIGAKRGKFSETSLNTIYGVDYIGWPVEQFACGTYELIPPSQALEMVQNGDGSLVYLNEKNGDDIVAYQPRTVSKFTIFSINIGYYEEPEKQEFLQPVYIISGEATLDTGVVGIFHYYVPAISYDLVQDKIIFEEVIEDTGGALF